MMTDMSIRSQLPCVMLLCDGDTDIGRAICSKFLALRYRVILAGAQIDNASWVSDLLEKHKEVRLLQSCGKTADLSGYTDSIVARQPVDVLVHIAAVDDGTKKNAEILIGTIARSMLKHGCGRIIHIAGGGNEIAVSPSHPTETDAYPFIATLAQEAAHSPVTVNTITLGCIGNTSVSPQTHTTDSRNVCSADAGKLQEIARLAAYLASDEAAGIHGASIAINTGRYFS